MNLHRLDLVSLSLFSLVVRTGSISRGAELAHLAVGAASKRIRADMDHLAADLSDHAAGIVGVLRLVAITSAVTQFLPVDLARIGRRLRVRIRVRSLDAI